MRYISKNRKQCQSKPQVILRGTKLISIKFNNIKYIDSYSFIPMALANFPKTFGMTELKKGFFPHKFNTPENQNYKGAIPGKEYYQSDYFSQLKKKEFDIWYESQKDKVFNFKQEFHDYCWSDVLLLSEGCLRFIKINKRNSKKFPNDEGIDPLQTSLTLAAYCNVLFRRNHMQPESIIFIPETGFNPKQTTSIACKQFINYQQSLQQQRIQFAGNELGEKKWGRYYFDGFCEETKSIYEFHGCLWHGCPRCYSGSTFNPFKQCPQSVVYDMHVKRINNIKSFWEPLGFKIIEQWECDWKEKAKNDPAVQAFLEKNITKESLNERSSICGGRTEGIYMYYKVEGDEKIFHIDYTSLYPDRQKNGIFPVGPPEILTSNLDWNENYFGIVYCSVIPPRKLFLPVLPVKLNKKLLFTLCTTCAINSQQEPWSLNDKERAIEGVWTGLEIELAFKMGYVLKELYEVWNFKKYELYDPVSKTGGLFTSYINTQLKEKQESSGWPSEIISDEAKHNYIDEYEKHEGIKLEFDKIEKNPGRRSISKLLCNSQWGYMALNTNKTQLKIIRNAHEWYELLDRNEICINHVDLNESENGSLFVYYTESEKIHEGRLNTNVILAAFVTSQARIKLYGELSKLNERVLYYDTDSIIYRCKPGEYKPPNRNLFRPIHQLN